MPTRHGDLRLYPIDVVPSGYGELVRADEELTLTGASHCRGISPRQ